MERKMNLRNGKQEGTEERSEEEKEERRHRSGDFEVQYLEQGREQSDGNVTGDELEEQEDRRQQRNNNDQLMEFLISMRGEIKQDMNNMRGDFNEKMDNINGNMNRLERKIEEVKIEGLKEIKKLRQENEDFKKRIDKVQENMEHQNKNLRIEIQEKGIKIREEIEKKVVEEVQALGKCIEENLPETILMEVTRQNEEVMQEYQENFNKKIKDLDVRVEEKTGTCAKRNETIGKQFNRELEEINKKLRETVEDIEDKIRRNGVGIMCTGNVEIGVKFDGNINTIHPKVFMKIVKSKMKGIKDLMEMKIIIRGMLSGHALMWFCNKEEQIIDMEGFETQFLMYFWGEIQQANFRERLYFGKFDYNKNKNLNSYAMQLYNIAQYLEPAMKEEELVLYVGRHFNAEMSETIVLHNIKTMDNMSSYLQRVERSIQNGNGINRYQSENRYEDIRNDRQGENGNGFFRKDHYDRYGNTNYGNRNFENRRYQRNVDRNFGNGDRGRYNGQNNFRNSSHRNGDDFNRQYDRGVYNGNRSRNLQQQDRGNFRRDEYNFDRDQRSDNNRDNNANSPNERESVRQVNVMIHKERDEELVQQDEDRNFA
ncbi:uncharacterized protein PF3D7_1120000-like [Diorhabda carinulata]|uniref:uncharacterized protein PF3D7_1120000-like n=1 Tax=Diorhabda carinulata TaxID=1163345 RepID=UPI0025A0AF68|nr:uncharacterized protein PF3D7_1120000-like [Diorhabda carinulata]